MLGRLNEEIVILQQSHKVLTNPVYCGKVKFKGEIFEGSHFPLIKESTINKAQHILSDHAQTQAKTKRQFT
ncbi:MAG: hypothetical protein EBY38_08990 [Flavobacteriaceae bacterium]|nr:hypothetical protein [Flavobacteriaceae bacterium]